MTTITYREQETRNRIIRLIEENSDGLTISDISRILEIHYTTASKYLAILEAEKKIIHRGIGMAKLFRMANGNGGANNE
jgi:Mn-dependent DtxR family transcriptional regulator